MATRQYLPVQTEAGPSWSSLTLYSNGSASCSVSVLKTSPAKKDTQSVVRIVHLASFPLRRCRRSDSDGGRLWLQPGGDDAGGVAAARRGGAAEPEGVPRLQRLLLDRPVRPAGRG